jgi:transketolase
MMKMLPNMVVINPADHEQTRQATLAIAEHHGPVYLRFGRPKVPVFYKTSNKFEIGKADVLMTGTDITIIATGHLVWEALQAAKQLKEEGVSAEVINMHTIKPIDEKAIIESASKTGRVVTAEEHQKLGGLGESVAQVLAENRPTPMRFVAVNDSFGESGKPAQLMEKYGLSASNIVAKAKELL